MSEYYRITIRNIDPELGDLFRTIAYEKGQTLGDTFDDAILALESNWDESGFDEPVEGTLMDNRLVA